MSDTPKADLSINKTTFSVSEVFIRYRFVILSSFITAFLTYIYAFTNKIPNHDDVSQLFAKGTTLESGRWGLVAMSYIFPDFSMPWIYGVISIVFITIAVCVIVRMFDIQNRIYQSLLAALIIAFPSLIGVFTYMFTATSFSLSFLFAVVSVWLLKKKKVSFYILSVLLMTFSLSIYQSYISVAVGLLMVLIIKMIINKESAPKSIIKNIALYLSFLVLSAVLYYLITQLIFTVTNTSFGYYANQNLATDNVPVLQRIKIAYAVFFGEFFSGTNGLIPTMISRALHAILLVVIGLKGVIILARKESVIKKLLLIFVAILFPLGINCMYLITESSAVHTLVMYGFVSVYVLAFVLLEEETSVERDKQNVKRVIRSVSVVAFIGIVLSNIFIGNEVFLRLQLKYENAYSFYTSLVAQIKSNTDFTPGTKVALVGETKELIYPYNEFDNTNEIMGSDLNVNIYSRNQFIKYYCGFDANFASEEEIKTLSESQAFKDMNLYPYFDSVRKIDNYLVVKFSDQMNNEVDKHE